MKNKKNKPLRPFKIGSPKDLTDILEIASHLHCSRATMYRTIKNYQVPVFHFVECLRHMKFISCFNLYRLIKSPAFKKYYEALTEYAEIPEADQRELTWHSSLEETAKQLKLSNEQLDAGIKSGLIPCIKINNEIKVCGWFLPAAESVQPWF